MLEKESFVQTLLKNLSKYSYINASIAGLSRRSQIKYENLKNRDSLPLNLILHGFYRDKLYKCKVTNKGYIVNKMYHNTLSEAAREVTGVRTEGWRFWKVYEKGPSILDIFKESDVLDSKNG